MKKVFYKESEPGQALVELIVVLPILLLFLATICPLLAHSVVMSWLDERLWLKQVNPNIENLHSELENTHEKTLLPLYFSRHDFEESTNLEKIGLSFPLLYSSFPGSITVRNLLANYPESGRVIIQEEGWTPKKASRSLAMLTSPTMTEQDIPQRIQMMSVLGIFPWKTKILNNLGFDLFHLNMDSLPETVQ